MSTPPARQLFGVRRCQRLGHKGRRCPLAANPGWRRGGVEAREGSLSRGDVVSAVVAAIYVLHLPLAAAIVDCVTVRGAGGSDRGCCSHSWRWALLDAAIPYTLNGPDILACKSAPPHAVPGMLNRRESRPAASAGGAANCTPRALHKHQAKSSGSTKARDTP